MNEVVMWIASKPFLAEICTSCSNTRYIRDDHPNQYLIDRLGKNPEPYLCKKANSGS
jgi:hypothetical protein